MKMKIKISHGQKSVYHKYQGYTNIKPRGFTMMKIRITWIKSNKTMMNIW